jgi:phage terminase small subunit
MKKIGDIPRCDVTESDLIEFGGKVIDWLTVRDEDGNPTDNFLYSEFCQQNNFFEEDIDYFINISLAFFNLMKRAEEIQRTKIEGFAASGVINTQIAKKLLSKKSKIVRKENKNFKKPNGVTNKQAKFCREYIIDRNATKAALRAGYKEDTAREQGCRLLTKRNIEIYISELEQKSINRNEITKDRILREMSFIAFSDIRDYLDDDNQVISIKSLSKEKAAAVKKVKYTRTEIITDGEHVGNRVVTEIELIDKQRALADLDKHAGLFNESIEIENKNLNSNKTEVIFRHYGEAGNRSE